MIEDPGQNDTVLRDTINIYEKGTSPQKVYQILGKFFFLSIDGFRSP